LPALLAEADIISLHLPLTPDTEHMIDARAIAAMKPGSVLVNTARGGLVDEAALIDALKSGHLRAAGLDVVTVEPAPAGNPLFDLDNVVVIPHIAWITPETLDRSLGIAFENCLRLRDGEDLLHRVV
jgi:phosphoglycerate dehydrogenase-like enzyme